MSKLQRVLFGAALAKHIAVDPIGMAKMFHNLRRFSEYQRREEAERVDRIKNPQKYLAK